MANLHRRYRTRHAIAALAAVLSLGIQVAAAQTTPPAGTIGPAQQDFARQTTSDTARGGLPPLAPYQPLTLVDAWQTALQYDPTYQAAISERDAGQTERGIGRSGLLPQINLSSNRSKIRGKLDSPGAYGDIVRQDLDYTSRVDEIRGTQTVFDWGRISEYRQGHARADYSLAVFDTKENDTSYRLINRYFQTLLAFENVALTESRLDANEKQLTAAERRFDGGEGTITEVRETKSRRDMTRADLILAKDDLKLALYELQEMVGRTPLRLFRLKENFVPGVLEPATLEGWMAQALGHNPEIRASAENVRISEIEVHRNFSGHLPTLDIIAAGRKVEGETISTRAQTSKTRSIGFQAKLPIFSGGLTHARVTQARHNRDRSRFELEATQDQVVVDVTRQYQAVISGAERIAALVVAVESASQAQTAVERGFESGTRSLIDVLDAQDLVYQARLDLMQARLEYIVGRLKLAGAADALDVHVFSAISDDYFSTDYVDIG